MSLMIQAYLLEQYGPRLSMKELAEAINRPVRTLYNQVSAGTLEVPTYKDGSSRFADMRDVASYLDQMRLMAA